MKTWAHQPYFRRGRPLRAVRRMAAWLMLGVLLVHGFGECAVLSLTAAFPDDLSAGDRVVSDEGVGVTAPSLAVKCSCCCTASCPLTEPCPLRWHTDACRQVLRWSPHSGPGLPGPSVPAGVSPLAGVQVPGPVTSSDRRRTRGRGSARSKCGKGSASHSIHRSTPSSNLRELRHLDSRSEPRLMLGRAPRRNVLRYPQAA